MSTDDFDDPEDDPQDDLWNEPLEVIVSRQAVVLIGPDGVNLAMSVEAVEKSIELLRDAVAMIRKSAANEKSKV